VTPAPGRELSLIVALSQNNVIGREGTLPFRQSADLQRFKKLTMGHHLIMGRKTFASLGRALPGRTSIVLSRQDKLSLPEGMLHAHDFAAALHLCSDDPEPFVIGGGEIYRLALPHVTKLYITRIEAQIEGDVHFPAVDLKQWTMLSDEAHPADARNQYPVRFQAWQRRRPDTNS
jgi:dihydrofolate reductase